jgi:hypothetical protein
MSMQEMPVLLHNSCGEVAHMDRELGAMQERLTHRMHVRLTEDEWQAIATVAERYGVTRSLAARALLRRGLASVFAEWREKEKPPR